MINGQKVGEKGHVYFFDGYRYPSVTTILHKVEPEPYPLTRWKQTFVHRDFATPAEYSTYSAIRGTFVHYAILNKLSPTPLPGDDLPKMSTWRAWQDKVIEEVRHAKLLWEELGLEISLPPVCIETPMCHHGLWYAGTPDAIARVDFEGEDCLTVIDLKTSKQPYPSHFRQIGAYTQMINDSTHEKVTRGLLIYLSKTMKKARVEVVYEEDIKEEIYEFNKQRKRFYTIPGVLDEYGLVIPNEGTDCGE